MYCTLPTKEKLVCTASLWEKLPQNNRESLWISNHPSNGVTDALNFLQRGSFAKFILRCGLEEKKKSGNRMLIRKRVFWKETCLYPSFKFDQCDLVSSKIEIWSINSYNTSWSVVPLKELQWRVKSRVRESRFISDFLYDSLYLQELPGWSCQ